MNENVQIEYEQKENTKLVKREDDDLFELDYYSNPEDEAINYLRQMLRLSKRKIRSKKLDNYGKVRWARAGIEASKILLYSGVVDRSERRKTHSDNVFFADAVKQLFNKQESGKCPT